MNITINKRDIGVGHPAYIIAELSANHNQEFEQAVKLIHAAKEAGADAIKLQTYTSDTLTIDCDNEYFRIGKGTIWEGKNLYQLYKEAYTPWEWQPKLNVVANELGLDLFSTPFDFTAVDFLEKMGVPAYKIASFELVDLPLIRSCPPEWQRLLKLTKLFGPHEMPGRSGSLSLSATALTPPHRKR